MNINEFADKVNGIVEVLKPYDNRGVLKYITKKKDASRYPEYYPGYNDNLKQYHENLVHAKKKFPRELFDKIAPNQSAEDKAYIEATYECVTEEVFLEFSNTVKRGMANGNIEWPALNEKNEALLTELKEFIYDQLPKYNSLPLFIKAMTDEKLIDPNAIVAVEPVPEDVDEENNIVGGVMPEIIIYHTDRVVWKGHDEFIVESYVKTPVTVGNNIQNIGRQYIYFGKEFIMYADQYGKHSDWTFEYDEWQHGLKWSPAAVLMGMPNVVENMLNFISPFNKAVPNLNLALLDNVNLLIIKRKVTYPTRVFMAETCTHQQHGQTCNNGQITWSDGKNDPITETCTGCRGTGKIGVFGPMSEIALSIDRNGDGNPIKANDAMTYVSPPVETPKFLREEIDKFIDKAIGVLHLKAEPRSTGNITATEKRYDKKNTEAFVLPISDQIWYLQKFLIDTIGAMRYGLDNYEKVQPKFIKPESIDLKTSEDFLYLIKEAVTLGLPDIVKQSLIYNFLKTMDYSDSQSAHIFELIEQADRLISMSNDQVILGLSRGTVQKWEEILHTSGFYIITNLEREHTPTEDAPTFFDLEMSDQIEAVETAAKALVVTQEIGLPPAIPI